MSRELRLAEAFPRACNKFDCENGCKCRPFTPTMWGAGIGGAAIAIASVVTGSALAVDNPKSAPAACEVVMSPGQTIDVLAEAAAGGQTTAAEAAREIRALNPSLPDLYPGNVYSGAKVKLGERACRNINGDPFKVTVFTAN